VIDDLITQRMCIRHVYVITLYKSTFTYLLTYLLTTECGDVQAATTYSSPVDTYDPHLRILRPIGHISDAMKHM